MVQKFRIIQIYVLLPTRNVLVIGAHGLLASEDGHCELQAGKSRRIPIPDIGEVVNTYLVYKFVDATFSPRDNPFRYVGKDGFEASHNDINAIRAVNYPFNWVPFPEVGR